MTQILVKVFVKNYEKTDSVKVRAAYGILASMVGIICNFGLFCIKFIIGLTINSISVMADAFNNLSDAASSVISLFGVKISIRPADKEHPFGHGRVEYITALVVAFLVLQVGFSCFKSAFSKVLHPESVGFDWILVGILILSVGVKAWLSLFNKNLGKRINSSVMKATSADAFGDALITSATIISIIVGKLTGLKIDGWMGLFVSVFVLYAGFNIAKETLMPLIGEPVDREVYRTLTERVEGYTGIVGSHDLIVHNYGPSRIMATIHAEVPSDSNLEEIHKIIDSIERDVYKEMGIFLVIHMDPIEINDSLVMEKKNMVVDVVRNLEPKATIHDFRVVNSDNYINLIFDLVVPFSYDEKREQQFILQIIQVIQEINPMYKCLIQIENSYVAEL